MPRPLGVFSAAALVLIEKVAPLGDLVAKRARSRRQEDPGIADVVSVNTWRFLDSSA